MLQLWERRKCCSFHYGTRTAFLLRSTEVACPKYNIEVKERELTNEEKQAQSLRESLFVVNQFASEYFQDVLYNHIDGQRIGMTYLRGRGFRDDIIKKFQLGYSTDSPDALAKAAIQKGYKEEFLVKTGLCYRKDNGSLHDRFWGRVIFPVHTLSGKVVASADAY